MRGILVILLILLLSGCAVEKITEQPKEVEKMDLSGKKILVVLAPKDFRDEEYFEPKRILEGYGAKITTASKGTEAVSMVEKKKVRVDILLNEATTDYDAIVFIGGSGSEVYFDDETALDLVKSAYEQGKVIAAICIAPSVLANAGILKGKKATVSPSEENNLKEKGAIYTGKPVTQDGKIITARGPSASKEFGETIAKALSG